MLYPVKDSQLGQRFGEDPETYAAFGLLGHNGQDFPVGMGSAVFAPEDATVLISANGTKDQYTGAAVAGETIVLQGKYEHWLLHNSQRLVNDRDRVREGQLIAFSGNTGFSTGPHCHWGVRPLSPDLNNGYRGFVDPLSVKEQAMKQEQDYPNKGDLVNIFNELGWPGHEINDNDVAYWCEGTDNKNWGNAHDVNTALVIQVGHYMAAHPMAGAITLQPGNYIVPKG